jgi:hypothetical protein
LCCIGRRDGREGGREEAGRQETGRQAGRHETGRPADSLTLSGSVQREEKISTFLCSVGPEQERNALEVWRCRGHPRVLHEVPCRDIISWEGSKVHPCRKYRNIRKFPTRHKEHLTWGLIQTEGMYRLRMAYLALCALAVCIFQAVWGANSTSLPVAANRPVENASTIPYSNPTYAGNINTMASVASIQPNTNAAPAAGKPESFSAQDTEPAAPVSSTPADSPPANVAPSAGDESEKCIDNGVCQKCSKADMVSRNS